MVHTGQEIKDALDAEREENFRNVLRADLETQRKQNQAIMQAIRDEGNCPGCVLGDMGPDNHTYNYACEWGS
jgi:hypothetical protein